jgi:hypothetical protein
MLKLFNKAPLDTGKVVVLDEAHKVRAVVNHSGYMCTLTSGYHDAVSLIRDGHRRFQAIDGSAPRLYSPAATSRDEDNHLDVNGSPLSMSESDADAVG